MKVTPQAELGRELRGGMILGIFFLCVSVAYLAATLASGNDFVATIYPLLCGAILLGLLISELIASGRKAVALRHARADGPAEEANPAEEGEEALAAPQAATRWKVFVPLFAATAAFAYVATQVDYLIGTAAYIFVAIWLIGRKQSKWYWAAAIAVGAAVGVYFLFVVVLQLYLPTIIPGL